MNRVTPEFDLIKINNPQQGNDIAEQTARLILLGTYDTPEPTDEQVLDVLNLELDGHLSVAAVNLDGEVVGTGGLLLVEEGGEQSALILNLVVEPRERGQGLSIKIMSMLEEEAMMLNATEAFGQPHPQYIGFYEKLGYRLGEKPHLNGYVVIKPL